MKLQVKTGLSILRDERISELRGKNIGVLCHAASVDENFCHIIDILAVGGIMPEKIFAPEHGIFADAQDQAAVNSITHPKYDIPVVSLYGKSSVSLKPESKLLSDLDIVVIDLQDIGARYYTFVWTAALLLEVAAETGTVIMIPDRPNPITGFHIEGPVQDTEHLSFVGLHPLPIRHGLTIGEIMLYVKQRKRLDVELDIIPMRQWNRRFWFEDTKLPWVMPSPNMPTLDTAAVYPGMCLLEGTNLSEGRGTTRPFEIFGAPFIEPFEFCERIEQASCITPLHGFQLRPLYFTPAFNKYSEQKCGGAQIHITDRENFKPVITAFAIIKAALEMYPEKIAFREPPYEYEHKKLPFDILTGSPRWRNMLLKGAPIQEFESAFDESAGTMVAELKKFHLYG